MSAETQAPEVPPPTKAAWYAPKPGQRQPILERFWSKVDASGDCWEWTGSRDGCGYGMFQVTTHLSRRSHRLAWEYLVGAIPDGYQLDHLCRNPACVNPDHLEPVTHGENTRRGFGAISRNRHLTICKHGHPLTPGNIRPKGNNGRECISCRRRISREAYWRNKARRAA